MEFTQGGEIGDLLDQSLCNSARTANSVVVDPCTTELPEISSNSIAMDTVRKHGGEADAVSPEDW